MDDAEPAQVQRKSLNSPWGRQFRKEQLCAYLPQMETERDTSDVGNAIRQHSYSLYLQL
jgi:hypothetical protein